MRLSTAVIGAESFVLRQYSESTMTSPLRGAFSVAFRISKDAVYSLTRGFASYRPFIHCRSVFRRARKGFPSPGSVSAEIGVVSNDCRAEDSDRCRPKAAKRLPEETRRGRRHKRSIAPILLSSAPYTRSLRLSLRKIAVFFVHPI